jgi:type I restriction enzyme S subunit
MSKDGKKDSAELDTSTLPSLPKGWCWVKVGDAGDIKLGRQRSPEHHNGPHMRPYLRVANVYEDRINLSDVMEMNFTPQEYETYCLQHGDILLNEGQSLEWVGRPAMYRDEVPGVCFQNTLVRFRAKAGVDPAYALYLFRHYLHAQRFQRIAKWTVNIAHLGAQRFAEVEFPLAPSNEQHRIVAKIEELFSDLDAGVAALERVKANLKRYRATVLKAAAEGRLTEQWRKKNRPKETGQQLLDHILGERRRRWEEEQLAAFAKGGKTPPAKWKEKYKEPAGADGSNLPPLPEGWCWASVDQLLYGIEAGKSFECLPRPASPEEWGVIKVSAMTWGEFIEDENKAIPPDATFDPAVEVHPGDVLLSRSNTVELVGATVFVKQCRRKLLLSDKSMRLLVNTVIDRAWFQRVMSSRTARKQLSAMATGTSDSMRNVSQEKVLSVVVPLPPLTEQAEIVKEIDWRLSDSDAAASQIKANLKRSTRLRQSILKRAFGGKLVPQDPGDEPATTLLERIQKENGTTKPTRKTR